jgi:simple sugar transport system ATP-binding protein
VDDCILVAKGISKTYIGVQALDGINIFIKAGEVKCLAGENGSGKSTFVKIIAGVESADSGEIYLNGKHYPKLNAISAIEAGVQVIYQDLSLFGNMTVAENIAMNKLVKEKKSLVNKKEVHEIAKKTLDMIDISMDLDTKVQGISIANRQIIAICRALALDAKILFMDEPTTALTQSEIEKLLSIVNKLRNQGLAIVFISHKLEEVFSVADTITVFRDGKQVADVEKNEINKMKLVNYMTGRDITYTHYSRQNEQKDSILSVKNLTKAGQFSNISLQVRPGDIMGITGLLGSGRTELVLSIFGLNPPDSGEILFEGKQIRIKSPVDAVRKGIALIPEERATQGLFLNKDMTDNVSSAIIDKFSKALGILDRTRRLELANSTIKQFKVRIPDADTMIKTLSGGNQQKVVLGKWVATMPKLFILDSPTVGVDIGSKAEIYEQIQRLAKAGMAVILISDEIEEITANCNRVSIMFQGKIVKQFDEQVMMDDKAGQVIGQFINSLHLINKDGERDAV